MDVRTLALILVTSLTLAACERSEAPQPAPGPTAAAPADPAEPRPAKKATSFVNRVWSVAESKQVEPGELRVFLSGRNPRHGIAELEAGLRPMAL